MKFQQLLWILIFVLSTSTLVRGQSFCLSSPSINKQRTESYKRTKSYQRQEIIEPCKLYWINIYIHRVIGTNDGWNGYTSYIESKVMDNLNSSFNQYGFYFELIGSRAWFNDVYTDVNTDPEIIKAAGSGIWENKEALPHTDAIDIYLLPSNSSIDGGFVPGSNKTVMAVGGTRTVKHCSGDTVLYEIAASKTVSHEMGHILGLPHTFDASIGTSPDDVTENECIDPNTCQFVSNCSMGCNVLSNSTINMNNFMSYTIPNCMTEFSDEQVSLMREKLDNTMTSVVDRTRSLPTDVIGDLIGPSEVSKGFLVRFSISDQAEGDDTFVWTLPTGFLLVGGADNSRSVRTWIGSAAESGNVRVRKTNLCGTSIETYNYVTVTPDDCMDCPPVKIFPNPAFNEIFINYSSEESGDQELFEKS